MSYRLGIDLGDSCTVAAISRTDVAGGCVEIVPLGTSGPAVSSVIHVGGDGSLLVGAAAERCILSDPDWVFRGFVRRIGEASTHDGPLQPETLTALLARWVVDVVSEQQGAWPDRIVLTHPPGWSVQERQLAEDALLESGVDDVAFVPTPVATVVGWLTAERLESIGTIAVYDLGGVLDVTILARTGAESFIQLGTPQTLDYAGAEAFDEIVFQQVLDALGDRGAATDLGDPAVLDGMAQLFEMCAVACKALSDGAAVAVPIALPGLSTSVEFTQSDFEAMIRPALLESIDALRGAVVDAGLSVPELDLVLVTGGAAAIPLVARLLADELGRPVQPAKDPLRVAAIGAAVAASDQCDVDTPLTEPTLPSITGQGPEVRARLERAVVPEFVAAQPSEPQGFLPVLARPAERPRRRTLLAAAAGVLAGTVAVVLLTITQVATNPPSAVSTAEAGEVGEQVGHRTPAAPGLMTSSETGTVPAVNVGTGSVASSTTPVVSPSAPVPPPVEGVAPRSVVAVQSRSAPLPSGPEALLPPESLPSSSDRPTSTAASPPRRTPINPPPRTIRDRWPPCAVPSDPAPPSASVPPANGTAFPSISIPPRWTPRRHGPVRGNPACTPAQSDHPATGR